MRLYKNYMNLEKYTLMLPAWLVILLDTACIGSLMLLHSHTLLHVLLHTACMVFSALV